MKTRKIVLDGDRSREADMPLFSFHADGNRKHHKAEQEIGTT